MCEVSNKQFSVTNFFCHLLLKSNLLYIPVSCEIPSDIIPGFLGFSSGHLDRWKVILKYCEIYSRVEEKYQNYRN